MQMESFNNIDDVQRPVLQQVYGPQEVISINKSGASSKAFSHIVENANGSRDMIISLKLGTRCFKQVIHISAPGEQREPCGREELLELDAPKA